MSKSQWQAELKAFSAELSASQPIPLRNTLTPELEQQCRIIGGDFISWHQYALTHIMNERHALKVCKFDPDPVMIFTSTMPGLVAAKEIIAHFAAQSPDPADSDIIYLLHDSFKAWCHEHPLEMTKYIHQWSYFEPLSEGHGNALSQDYPDIPVADFRVHISGDLWGKNCGREQSHLWHWNGAEMILLKESFSEILF